MIKQAIETTALGICLGFTAAAMVATLSKAAKSSEFQCHANGDGYACVSKDTRTGIDLLTATSSDGSTLALKIDCKNQRFKVLANDLNYNKGYISQAALQYCATR